MDSIDHLVKLGDSKAIEAELKKTKELKLADLWYNSEKEKLKTSKKTYEGAEQHMEDIAGKIFSATGNMDYAEKWYSAVSTPGARASSQCVAEFYTEKGSIAKRIFNSTGDVLWAYEWHDCIKTAQSYDSIKIKEGELAKIEKDAAKKLNDPAWLINAEKYFESL